MEQIREQDLMTSIGYFCPVDLEEGGDREIRVETVNEPFDYSKVINPDGYPVPKEGHIGYVKFENPQEYAELCEPRFFDVDEHGFEIVG